jgi:ribosomal protein S12 methylthiotransferase accessory factor
VFKRPQFKAHLHAEVVPPETVYLLSEKDHAALSGRLYVLLAPLLDGRHTVGELVECLEGQTTAPEVYLALMHLEGKGYLTENVDGVRPREAAFWSALGVEPRQAQGRLTDSRVAIRALGAVPAGRLAEALGELGIVVGGDGDFDILLVDDYLHEGLDAYNQEALARRRPWMLVKPVGLTLWLGPVPVTGAVSELRSPFAGTDGPVHVYFAGSNFSRPKANLRGLRQAMRQHSAAKA